MGEASLPRFDDTLSPLMGHPRAVGIVSEPHRLHYPRSKYTAAATPAAWIAQSPSLPEVLWGNYNGDMVEMAIQHEWVSVPEAAEIAGCSPQWLCRELNSHYDPRVGSTVGGRIVGFRAGQRTWLVQRASAVELRKTLSTRARLHEAEREAKSGRRPRPRRRTG